MPRETPILVDDIASRFHLGRVTVIISSWGNDMNVVVSNNIHHGSYEPCMRYVCRTTILPKGFVNEGMQDSYHQQLAVCFGRNWHNAAEPQ